MRDRAMNKLGMVKKTTNAHKCIKASYIKNIVCLLHVSATLVALNLQGGALRRVDITRYY